MANYLRYALAIFVLLHGLIHLMGTTTYWQLAEINELPYKTTILSGKWEIGESGIRIFGLLWLVAAIGFALAAYGFVTDQAWWETALLVSAVFSLMITGLDWDVAYAGIGINLIVLLSVILVPRLSL